MVRLLRAATLVVAVALALARVPGFLCMETKMLSDDDIIAALGHLWPLTYEQVPFSGSCASPPFSTHTLNGEEAAVIATDPGLAVLAVSRATGAVWVDASGMDPSLVSSSLAAFVASAAAYDLAIGALTATDEDALDIQRQAAAAAMFKAIADVDPVAAGDENNLWNVAAEELSYGL